MKALGVWLALLWRSNRILKSVRHGISMECILASLSLSYSSKWNIWHASATRNSSSLYVMPKSINGHALPNLSLFISMNKAIPICGFGPIVNIVQIGHPLSPSGFFPFIFPVSNRFYMLSLSSHALKSHFPFWLSAIVRTFKLAIVNTCSFDILSIQKCWIACAIHADKGTRVNWCSCINIFRAWTV